MHPLKIKQLLFNVLFVWFLGIILDLLAMFFVSLLGYFFKYDIYSRYSICLLSFINVSILIFLSCFSKVRNFPNFLYLKLSKFKNSIIILTIFLMFIVLIGIVIFSNLKHLNINILLFIVLILVFVTFIVLLKNVIFEKESELFLKTLKENNEFYIRVEDENRVFKHNLIAKLLSVKSVSNKKASVLIEDLLNQFNVSIDFSDHIKFIPYGLNGIIYQKIYPFLKELDVKIYNDITDDIFEYLKPRRYNVLIEKMVISLDNAIESALNSVDKLVAINIFEENEEIIIEIKNSFSHNINIDLLGSKNYSTKGVKRGIGLFSALRNNEVFMDVKIVNQLFITKISAKKQL